MGYPIDMLRMKQSAAAPTTDPNFANVVLLSGFEGADASTSFTDESSFAHALTANGTAQVDTAQAKFGASSLLLDGVTGTFVSAANSTDWVFGTGQFTIEMFAYFDVSTGTRCLIAYGDAGGTAGWFLRHQLSPGAFRFQIGATSLTATWTRVLNQWVHVAVDRDASNVVRIYLDGAMLGKQTITNSVNNISKLLRIGQEDVQASTTFHGWIDEVRITKGVARYASDGGFTVPTAAYPRS